MHRVLIVILVVLLVGIGWYVHEHPSDYGTSRLYANQTYHFEALRVLNDTSVVGSDPNEVLQTIANVKAGDADGWFSAWTAEGDRLVALADHTTDPISKGRALLRAHNYYRSSDFFLPPADPRRPGAWKKNVDTFYQGLDTLQVRYERIAVPYGNSHLGADYYPGPVGSENKPLILTVSGYDGTRQEMYFSIVAAAHDRGYSVLAFDGPGQGSALRDRGLTMTPEWEKPTHAVLDTFLASHSKPTEIVYLGESLGGYLAPRAAAFDPRIDGVVSQDVFFDGGEAANRGTKPFVKWLMDNNHYGTLSFLVKLQHDPGAKWDRDNGMWVFGVEHPWDVLTVFSQYTLAPVAAKITADVLILVGKEDHFVTPDQGDRYKASLTHARSVTTIAFDKASGGAEHCQVGAPSLWQAVFFDWLAQKFQARVPTHPAAWQPDKT
jgi:alpha-beta hydrolase superfamily lysophospholipase